MIIKDTQRHDYLVGRLPSSDFGLPTSNFRLPSSNSLSHYRISILTHSVLLLILSLFAVSLQAQNAIGNFVEDEDKLYAETKQINQFFRRFNNEESPKGKRYAPSQPIYRNAKGRKTYLPMLFDLSNFAINTDTKQSFINKVLDEQHPIFLDFHGHDWFAEVKTKFLYKGEQVDISFYLQLEQENLGYKWVITNVFFHEYNAVFNDRNSDKTTHFLHPLSHELDFMNLIKVFKEDNEIKDYTNRGFKVDYLSIFMYEFKQGLFTFLTIKEVDFHFFQVPGWYFSLKEYNRSGNNSGWLISQLSPINEDEKQILMKYIYHE